MSQRLADFRRRSAAQRAAAQQQLADLKAVTGNSTSSQGGTAANSSAGAAAAAASSGVLGVLQQQQQQQRHRLSIPSEYEHVGSDGESSCHSKLLLPLDSGLWLGQLNQTGESCHCRNALQLYPWWFNLRELQTPAQACVLWCL